MRESKNYRVIDGKQKYLQKGYLHFDNRFWFPERIEELKALIANGLVSTDGYWAFSPFIKILVKSPRFRWQEEIKQYELETKIRPICFAAHKDSLILSYYAFALARKYEDYIERSCRANNILGLSDSILAYRPSRGKNNIQFAKEVFDAVKKHGTCSAIALDIKGYFDHLDHGILKKNWIKILGEGLPKDQYRIYKVLTKYSYVSSKSLLKKYRPNPKREEAMPTKYLDIVPGNTTHEKFEHLRQSRLVVTNDKPERRGIPQGSPMSSVLSNIYLVEFDEDLCSKAQEEGFLYRRYCDDILIVCATEKADELKKYITDKISSEDFNLEIQDRKVELIDFRPNSRGIIRAFKRAKTDKSKPVQTNETNEKFYYKSLQYLGFEYNGRSILIRPSSLSKYFRKMKRRLTKSVLMAYGRGEKSDKVHLRQILERYSHFGRRNFLTYAYKAASAQYKNSKGEIKEGMNSEAIRRQLRRHIGVMQHELNKKNEQRFKYKSYKGKKPMHKEVTLQ